ncbi:MAG: hypothetical protein QM622_08760 [Microbacterium sp.]
MKTWIVRFLSLYAFNIVVLLIIGLLTPAIVGVSVVWAAIVLTIAETLVKPFALKAFSRSAAKTADERTKAGETLVQTGIVLVVAAIVWVITLLLSSVSSGGSLFWAWVIPPIIIAIGWFVYSKVADRIEAGAGALYDQAEAGIRGSAQTDAAFPSAAAVEGRAELKDGLTAEQRKMLDDLGS